MHADLDLLCTAVNCTADDILAKRADNARRRVTDAEVVTLCVAQAVIGIPSDRRFRPLPIGACATSSPSCPSSLASTGAGGASGRRSTG